MPDIIVQCTIIKQNLEFEDMSKISPDELDKLILDGDLDKLEMVVLSGRGADLRGKSSWNEDVRRFLKKVPGYMVRVISQRFLLLNSRF